MTTIEDVARVRSNVVAFPIERRQDRAVVSTSFPMAVCIAFGIAAAAAFISAVGWAFVAFMFSL